MNRSRVPLRRLADIRVSNVDKKSRVGEIPVRLVNYTDVYYNDRLDPDFQLMTATATKSQLDVFRLLPGDVVMTKDSEVADDIGVAAYVERSSEEIVCGYHLVILRARPECLDARFLYWTLNSPYSREQLSLRATGVTRYGLRTDAIAELDLLLPSLEEQRHISDYLDLQTAYIDRLIDRQHKQIQAVEERLRSLAFSIFHRERSATQENAGSLSLEEKSDTWRPYKIAWHKLTASGTTPKSANFSYYDSVEGVPWVTTSELRERTIFDTVQRVSKSAFRDYSALKIFPEDTVLIAMYGATIGRVGTLGIPAATNQACCAIYGGETLDQRYLYWWLWTNTDFLLSMAMGSGQPNISQDVIRSLRIPAPSVDEQRQIVYQIEKIASEVESLTSKANRLKELLSERRTAMITSAISGDSEML